MERIETLIVSDNRMVRESLVALLAGTRFIVQHVATGAGMSLGHLSETRMALVVIDEEAAAVVGQVAQALPDAKIVALALRDTEGLMVRSLQLGASAYLTESVSPHDLLKTLEIVIADCAVLPFSSLGRLFPAGAAPSISEPASPLASVPKAAGSALARLSNREVNILEGLTLGESNKVIARNLDIAEATVKVHVKAILRKVRVKNRTQAAVWAMNNRVLDGDQAEGSETSLREAPFVPSGEERHVAALACV